MEKFLIVGLGNIGEEYTETRHNIGFSVLDSFLENKSLSYETVRYGEMATVRIKGRTLYLLKPNTFMNLSGKAVRYWGEKLKIKLKNLLVITDDLSIPYGSIRLRARGSSGGHNGLSNIELLLQTREYSRLRVGIGKDFQKGRQVDFVLGKWTPEENEKLVELLVVCIEAIESFVLLDIDKAMNLSNAKKV